MKYNEATAKLREHRKEIGAVRERMREVQAAIEPQEVEDYRLATTQGPKSLTQLFNGQRDLMVIHNMGKSCPYCTLWADGFNGVYHHLASRAAFVLTSPDQPEVQAELATSRGWRFPMAGHAGTSFAADMGYLSESGGWQPGISLFRQDGTRLLRLSDAGFGPGDDFCNVWHIFDLFPEGTAGWRPKMAIA